MDTPTTQEKLFRAAIIIIVVLVVVGIPLHMAWRFLFPPRIVWPPPPHADAGAVFAELKSPTNDQQTRLEYLKQLSNYNYLDLQLAINSVNPRTPIPNFLETQIFAKVNRVDAEFNLILGRRDEALGQLANGYRLGALMAQPQNHVLTRLIGIAVMTINAMSLETFALNACETPRDLEALMPVLQDLNARSYRPRYGDIMDRNINPIARIIFYKKIKQNMRDGRTRNYVAISRLLLVQAAASARHYQLTTGAYPSKASEFNALPGGLHNDPFGDGPLRFRMDHDEQTFYIYSLGPNKSDDAAAIVYDPTNGTISPGDLIVAIPPERKFPFPRDGLRARTIEDVQRQFPNGFPRDPFADSAIGYTICNTQPVVIMSFGPNTDESYYRSNMNPNSSGRYYLSPPPPTAGFGAPAPDPAAVFAPTTATISPTTGTTASGPVNPFAPGPFATSDAQPVGFAWPPPKSKERRPPPPLIPPTEHELLYDPTNGTVSDGDLFIIIPTPAP